MNSDGAVKVRVPATTANLGPGFDCLGMALQIYNEVELVENRGDAPRVQVSGSEAGDDIPVDDKNLVFRSASRVFGLAGKSSDQLGIRLNIGAPLARGMGSSASAIVAGMAAANRLLGNPIDEAALVFEMAKMEGHPDNVVPCYVGGLTASLMLEESLVYERVEPAANIRCVLLIPGYELSTQKARAALPQKVPLKDAVFNLCRVPLVFSALRDGKLDNLDALMDDRLHQPYRKGLIREFDIIVNEAERAGAAAVCLSGAGPTMLAIADETKANAVAAAMKAVLSPIDPGCKTVVAAPENRGCQLL